VKYVNIIYTLLGRARKEVQKTIKQTEVECMEAFINTQ